MYTLLVKKTLKELDVLKSCFMSEMTDIENKKNHQHWLALSLHVGGLVKVDSTGICTRYSGKNSKNSMCKYGVLDKIKVVTCEVRFIDGTIHRKIPIKYVEKYLLKKVSIEDENNSEIHLDCLDKILYNKSSLNKTICENVTFKELDSFKKKFMSMFADIEYEKIRDFSTQLRVGLMVKVDWTGVCTGKLGESFENSVYKYGIIEKIKRVNCEIKLSDGTIHSKIPMKYIKIDLLETVSVDVSYECPICYERNIEKCFKISCGHKACGECLEKWIYECYFFDRAVTCPLCRMLY